MCMKVAKVSLVGTPIRKFGQVFGAESSNKKFIRVRNSNKKDWKVSLMITSVTSMRTLRKNQR